MMLLESDTNRSYSSTSPSDYRVLSWCFLSRQLGFHGPTKSEDAKLLGWRSSECVTNAKK